MGGGRGGVFEGESPSMVLRLCKKRRKRRVWGLESRGGLVFEKEEKARTLGRAEKGSSGGGKEVCEYIRKKKNRRPDAKRVWWKNLSTSPRGSGGRKR